MNDWLIFRASNPDILRFMESRNITGDFSKLEEIYIQRLVNTASNLSASSLVWQEVFDNGVILPQDTVVHIWKGDMQKELAKVWKWNTMNYYINTAMWDISTHIRASPIGASVFSLKDYTLYYFLYKFFLCKTPTHRCLPVLTDHFEAFLN